jgi:hypothetical protein
MGSANPPGSVETSPAPPSMTDPQVRALGQALQRMAERTRDEPDYLPHPIAIAFAEAVRGGNLTDGDGTFGAREGPYQVHMGKARGHFALLDVADLRTGKVLAPEVVLRLLTAWDALAAHPGSDVPREVAAGVLAGVLGIDDASSSLLLRKAGLDGERVPKQALLERIEALPA